MHNRQVTIQQIILPVHKTNDTEAHRYTCLGTPYACPHIYNLCVGLYLPFLNASNIIYVYVCHAMFTYFFLNYVKVTNKPDVAGYAYCTIVVYVVSILVTIIKKKSNQLASIFHCTAYCLNWCILGQLRNILVTWMASDAFPDGSDWRYFCEFEMPAPFGMDTVNIDDSL